MYHNGFYLCGRRAASPNAGVAAMLASIRPFLTSHGFSATNAALIKFAKMATAAIASEKERKGGKQAEAALFTIDGMR